MSINNKSKKISRRSTPEIKYDLEGNKTQFYADGSVTVIHENGYVQRFKTLHEYTSYKNFEILHARITARYPLSPF